MIKCWIRYPGNFHDAVLLKDYDAGWEKVNSETLFVGETAVLSDLARPGHKMEIPLRSILYVEYWDDEELLTGKKKG